MGGGGGGRGREHELKFLAVVRFVSRRGQVMAAAAAQQPRHCSCFSSLFIVENSLTQQLLFKSQLEQEVIRTNSSAKIELFAG